SFTITTVPGTAGTTMANIQMVVWGGICAVVRDRRDGQLLAVTQMLGSWHSAVLGHTDAEAPRLECLPSAYGAAVVTTWTDQGRVMAATCEIAGSNPGTHWNVVQLSPQGRFPRAAVTLTSSLASATWLQSGLGIRYATRLGGGTWTAPVTMVAERTQDPSSEGCDPNQPFAFVSSNLNYPVFVWAWSCTHGSQRALFALSRDTGGRTNSRIRLNPGLGARDSSDLLPTLVFDDNTQHAVWLDRPSPSQARSVYHSHSVDHGLTWSLPKPLPTGSHDVDEPPVLTAMNKNVDVAWIGSSHGSVLLQAETVQGHHLYGHGTADRRGIVPPVWVDNLVVPGNAFTVESSSSSRGPIYLLLSPGSGDTAIGSCGHLLVDLPTTRIWSPSEYSSGNAGFFFSVSSTTLLGTEYFCQAVIYDDNGCGFALTRGLAMRVTLP
ncbi:MAG TPA: sialidase family protein, partial [Planctomycetota bacterium]|nr:sialidase family protein [Planctomycetota bacterium]